MDVRHLRYFVAVAEALSFAKAARDLHMSQPPLSKRIAEMEEVLGARLFDRSSKKVALTAAGEALLPPARAAVKDFDSAVRVARALSPATSRSLRIAMPLETSRTVLLDVVSRLHQVNLEANMSEMGTPEQERLLAAGEIDVALLRYPFDTHGLKVSPPLGLPLGVLMPASHPLAGRDVLHLTDLQPFPLVMFHRHVHPLLHDELLALCGAHGYVPPRILYGLKLTTNLLINEQAVTFVRKALLKRRGEGGTGELLWKPLAGSPLVWWSSAVCRTQDWGQPTRLALDAISESLQQHEGWVPMPRPAGKPARTAAGGRKRKDAE
ncbi:MAG: LysR family transcriptional regulator [Ideonella sp.]|nr:LysR family transcriptional regulator [Ideonella sp.]